MALLRKALVIGIGDYPTLSLKGAICDATAFADIISCNDDNDRDPNFAVQLRTDITSKRELRRLISQLFQGNAEMALFYFSGHGVINERGGYLLTPDHAEYDEGISMDEILTTVNASPAANKIVILDCCHAGTMAATRNNKVTEIADGVVILAASDKREEAVEINGQGLFTSLLLEGLRGGAADLAGRVTPGSIYGFIDQALGPWQQRPIFKANVNQFVVLRSVPQQVPKDVVRKLTTYFPNPGDVFPLNPTFEYTNKNIAVDANVAIFQNLQKLVSIGVVVPVGETFMFWAAQNSTGCRLTSVGRHYWRLVRDKLI